MAEKFNSQPFQGLSSGVFFENIHDSFLEAGQYIAYGKEPEDIEQMERPTYNQIFADATTTFTILIGIFFPSVTGKKVVPKKQNPICLTMFNCCILFSRNNGWLQSFW